MENANTKLLEILAEARHNYRKSMDYFEQFKAEENVEMKQVYWARSEEYDGKCEGLLTAYEIITGRCVLSHLIGEEIKYLKAKMTN